MKASASTDLPELDPVTRSPMQEAVPQSRWPSKVDRLKLDFWMLENTATGLIMSALWIVTLNNCLIMPMLKSARPCFTRLNSAGPWFISNNWFTLLHKLVHDESKDFLAC